MATAEKEASGYNYNRFAELIKSVDETFLQTAPDDVQSVLDVGIGSGAVVEHLFELGKIRPPYRITGIDYAAGAVEEARKNLAKKSRGPGQINIFKADAQEKYSFLPEYSQDLVTCLNMIHLLDDPLNVFQQAYRVLKLNGAFLVSSAYEEHSYPEGIGRFWGTILHSARTSLKEDGYTDIPKGPNYFRLSADNYKRLAQEAGFKKISIKFHTEEMDKDMVEAICDFEAFAAGALPEIPINEARKALTDGVEPAFNRFSKLFEEKGWKGAPRRWMFLTATKSA